MNEVFIHCNMEETKFELSDINEIESFAAGVRRYRTLKINSDVTIFLTEKQAQELCEVLEEGLYDEPTYEQLQRENMSLMNELDRIKEEPYGPEAYDLNYECIKN